MEVIISLLVVVFLSCLLFQLARVAADRLFGLFGQSRRPVCNRLIFRHRLGQLNVLARQMQVALFHLDQAPDFRRAALWAERAQSVPVAFRQRQFRRCRSLLVQHYARCLRAGQDNQALLDSLRELLTQLGISTFEADYIRTEAESRMSQRTVPVRPSYEQRMAQFQRDHEQRTAAIRNLPNLDGEAREQLLEAEESRFRQGLMELGNQDSDTSTV